MLGKERLYSREKREKGILVRELFSKDEKGEIWIGTLVAHPGAEFYELHGEKKNPVYFRLTGKGRKITNETKGLVRGARGRGDLEAILSRTLGRLFNRGNVSVDEAFAGNTRIRNLARRISVDIVREEEQIRRFLEAWEGHPPLYCIGSFPFWTREELIDVRNMGEKTIKEIDSGLRSYGILLPTERVS